MSIVTRPLCFLLLASIFLACGFGCISAERAWKKADVLGTKTSYLQFIRQFPDSELATSAASRVEDLNWEVARRGDSIESIENFVSSHPKSRRLLDAEELIEGLRWKAARKVNTLDALAKFLRAYPTSKRATEAEEVCWQITSRTTHRRDYKKFLQLFPRGEHESNAREALSAIYWQLFEDTPSLARYHSFASWGVNVQDTNEAEALLWASLASARHKRDIAEFLSLFPETRFTEIARATIEDIDWKQADARADARGYESFVELHPSGAHSIEAEAALEKLYWEEALLIDTAKAYSKYLGRFPNGNLLIKTILDQEKYLEEQETITTRASLHRMYRARLFGDWNKSSGNSYGRPIQAVALKFIGGDDVDWEVTRTTTEHHGNTVEVTSLTDSHRGRLLLDSAGRFKITFESGTPTMQCALLGDRVRVETSSGVLFLERKGGPTR